MFSRARYFVALGLAYALSLSCSGDDDDDAPADAGAGGEQSTAGTPAGGTSSSGSSAGGDSSGGGATGPGQAGEAPLAGAGAGGVGASGGSGETGGLAGDAGHVAGGAAGASATGGQGGAAGASAAGGEGGAASLDFSCDYPGGTPCYHTVEAGTVSHGQIGPGEIAPGAVYVITIAAQGAEDVDLRVCASDLCQGDQACESSGSGSEESCVVQASQDFISVHVTNQATAPANVRIDMETDTMFEFKLSYTQSQSSYGPNRSHRLLVTGLTPATTYELSVQPGNARDVNLLVSSDLHAQQVLCDADLMTTAAICEVTAPQSALWVLITDTSGLGDSYKFRVVAK